MNYQDTLIYIFSQLPMFQRTGKAAYKADLSNTLVLDEYLKYPHKKFKSIHVAGTNGKGSVSHYLASVLQTAGFKVGLYTSPHLKDFRERIKVNGNPIRKDEVVRFIVQHKKVFESIESSFFEMTVAMAFNYFADQKVDYAIVETGLGGRLDSTNVITPLLSVITNISLDHTNLLGNSLKEIATEKSGVIKYGVPVVVGERECEVDDVFISKSEEKSAKIFFANEMFKVEESFMKDNVQIMQVMRGKETFYEGLKSGLMGIYQQKNIQTVLSAIECLRLQGVEIDRSSIYKGIAEVVPRTGLKGRWQILQENPLVVCDIAHNEAGIRDVVDQLKITPFRRLHIVFGTVNDKDIDPILEMLPREAEYYFTRASIPRAMNEVLLSEKAKKIGLIGTDYFSVKEALKTAMNKAHRDDLVFVGGSAFVVAEAI